MTVTILLAWAAAEFFISPQGSDRAAGTRQAPFQTMERARDAARAAAKPVTVWLQGGEYRRERALELTVADSEVTWQAVAGSTVRVQGGRRLQGGRAVTNRAVLDRLKPEARSQVVEYDLRRLGTGDVGQFVSRGFSRPMAAAHAEVFFDGRRMTVARWPNDGFAKIARPADPSPPDDDHGRRHGRLEYGFYLDGAKPARWQTTKNVWAHGYWSWDWANTYEEVTEFDYDSGLVKTRAPHGLYGFRTGQRFYFLNVLEELDAPGEYYVDAEAGKLYFWPPRAGGNAEIALSLAGEPLLRIRGASNVTWRGMTFEWTRASAIEIAGGAQVRIDKCVIRNVGNAAVMVDGGVEHTVNGCEIYHTGDGGVFLKGGDRATLTPGKHSATNNRIHHIAEWSRTYQPGVRLEGVGHRVAHNLIHHSPHNGILMNGNDHLIEYNEIHHVCLETGDVGAFYMGRDYTERGVEIRYNYFHDTGGVGMGSMGVYLDDCASGARIYGNVFSKTERAVFVGGGRDHLVENNIFVDCTPAVHLDARGLDPRPVWQNMVYKTMKERLADMRYLEPPYITRYPALATLEEHYLHNKGIPPEGNRVIRNICVRGKWLNIAKLAQGIAVDFTGNMVDEDPHFVNEAGGDFRLRPDSPALSKGFQPIPWDRIGPRD